MASPKNPDHLPRTISPSPLLSPQSVHGGVIGTSTFTMCTLSHHTDVFKLTPFSPFSPYSITSSPSPLILHRGFLSPAPTFPIDALSTHLAPTSRAPSPLAPPFHAVFHFDDDPDENDNTTGKLHPTAKSPKKTTSRPASENPQRPPVKPHAAIRSKFELEPNPFDLSFSNSHRSDSQSSDRATPPRGTDATSIKHNALPPLSSLTSPAAADPSQFPWLAAQSLRTGPLSPAMLAGPQNGGQGTATARPAEGQPPSEGTFDSNTFRTGFTPGAGTGFTPGYSSLMAGNFASSLPMPSPNTAAFLNMVTNSTPLGDGSSGEQNQGQHPPHDGQAPHPPSAIPPHLQHASSSQHGLSHLQNGQQDTITPGTLSALTGVYNDMNRGVSQGPHPPQFFQPGMQHHPSAGHLPPGAHHPHPQGHGVDYAQQSANAASQAANGLFLLSQAHQELSKREEEVRGTPLMGKHGVSGLPPNARPPQPPVGIAPPPPLASNMTVGPPPMGTGGQKRKSDTGSLKGSAIKKGKKNSPPEKFESTSPNFDDSDDEHDGIDKKTGKPETEEEKRKNFLERNRQGRHLLSPSQASS
jgi:ATF/CREB family transcription factor